MLGTRGPLSLRGRGARGRGGGPGSAPLTLVPVPPAPPPQTRRRAHGAGAAAVAARSRDSCLSVCLEAPPRKAPVSASCRRPRGAQARQGPSARGALCLAGPASPGTGSARRTRGQRTGRAGSGRREPPREAAEPARGKGIKDPATQPTRSTGAYSSPTTPARLPGPGALSRSPGGVARPRTAAGGRRSGPASEGKNWTKTNVSLREPALLSRSHGKMRVCAFFLLL